MTAKKLKIMIIEDETCIRESLTWHLEDLGHTVVANDSPFDCAVYNGGTCSKKVYCTEVLLIDQHLPVIKGLDFIEELCERGCKGIRSNILLMSGDTTSIDQEKAKALGVTVVQKPMDFEYLEKWLSEVKVPD
jgi:CheY-like chemotaxis protein